MKKAFLLLFFCGILSSCTNDDNESGIKIIEQNIVISNGENFEHSLGLFGDYEGAEITRQAEHFETSKLQRISDNGEIIYQYEPQGDFVGTDYVEITAGLGSNGVKSNTQASITKISIEVTQ